MQQHVRQNFFDHIKRVIGTGCIAMVVIHSKRRHWLFQSYAC